MIHLKGTPAEIGRAYAERCVAVGLWRATGLPSTFKCTGERREGLESSAGCAMSARKAAWPGPIRNPGGRPSLNDKRKAKLGF